MLDDWRDNGGEDDGRRFLVLWNARILVIREAPEAISRAMATLTKGEAKLRVQHERLDGLEKHIERASNRLGFSLIIAAVVVASSILVSAHSGPHLEGIPLLGLVGYVIAGVLGLWWAIAVLRSGKYESVERRRDGTASRCNFVMS
jgi:hypothetical protein